MQSVIYVDEVRTYKSGKWCHMWTNGDDSDLDRFAESIGLKKYWSHTSNGFLSGRFYHYDLRPSKRTEAIKNGAKFMSLRDWIRSRIR